MMRQRIAIVKAEKGPATTAEPYYLLNLTTTTLITHTNIRRQIISGFKKTDFFF